jgi:hypothetical protein
MALDLGLMRAPEPGELSGGNSPALYDSGEEAWPRKLHLGCGGIYLRGYINIDIAGRQIAGPPDPEAEANSTDIWDYYRALSGSAFALPKRRPTVADLRGNLFAMYGEWGLRPASIDKIVCVQMFEHLTPTDGIDLLVLAALLLRPGAPLILSVPDMADTLDWLEYGNAEQKAFAIRHMRGSRRDAYNHHKAWYTQESLGDMLTACGFRWMALPNFHLYPAIVVRARIG